MSERPLLKQFGDLRRADFEAHPVWVQCHLIDYEQPWYDATDEETFRAWTAAMPVHPTQALFLIKATFTLFDGRLLYGFITPAGEQTGNGKSALATIQPHIFHPSGTLISFWFGIASPSDHDVTKICSLLGIPLDRIFPIKFEAQPGLATGTTSGVIPGFCYIENDNTVRVKH